MAQQVLVQQQNLWKSFFIFLLPLIVTNILQSLSGTINTIYVGQMLGVHAIAAVAVFFPILFCLMAFVIGLSAGSTVLVGQAWGAKNLEKVRCVVGSTLFMTLIGGSLIALLGVIFAENILLLLGTDPDDRKSTRLNSSHVKISYAVFCLKKKSPNYIYQFVFNFIV